MSIPARAEMIISAKLSHSIQTQFGMITPIASTPNGISDTLNVAYAVIEPRGRTVPIAIMNTATEPTELVSGTKLAECCPLVKSANPHITRNSRSPTTGCAEMGVSKLQTEIDSAIDSSLNAAEKEKITKLLLEFSDAFSEELELIDVTKHMVNTSDHTPIKQLPRHLPYFKICSSYHVFPGMYAVIVDLGSQTPLSPGTDQ